MATRSAFIPRPVQRRITGLLLIAFFSILIAIFLLPFISILLTSFKDSSLIMKNGFNLDFDLKSLKLDNYIYVFSGGDHNYFRWFANSIMLTFVQTVLTLFVSA
jgi:arabinosaccharide transport system permease protein